MLLTAYRRARIDSNLYSKLGRWPHWPNTPDFYSRTRVRIRLEAQSGRLQSLENSLKWGIGSTDFVAAIFLLAALCFCDWNGQSPLRNYSKKCFLVHFTLFAENQPRVVRLGNFDFECFIVNADSVDVACPYRWKKTTVVWVLSRRRVRESPRSATLNLFCTSGDDWDSNAAQLVDCPRGKGISSKISSAVRTVKNMMHLDSKCLGGNQASLRVVAWTRHNYTVNLRYKEPIGGQSLLRYIVGVHLSNTRVTFVANTKSLMWIRSKEWLEHGAFIMDFIEHLHWHACFELSSSVRGANTN